jgi:hypothetical protein
MREDIDIAGSHSLDILMVCVPGVIDSGFRPCRRPRWHRRGDAWMVRRAMRTTIILITISIYEFNEYKREEISEA